MGVTALEIELAEWQRIGVIMGGDDIVDNTASKDDLQAVEMRLMKLRGRDRVITEHDIREIRLDLKIIVQNRQNMESRILALEKQLAVMPAKPLQKPADAWKAETGV